MKLRSRVEASDTRSFRLVGLLTCSLVGIVGGQFVQAAVVQGSPERSTRLLVADFNQPGWRTNLGDPFGSWDHDPGDQTQFCRVRLVEMPRVGTEGYSLQLDYDEDSPNPAYNGFWMKLPSIPLRQFRTLSLTIMGEGSRGFTKRVKLELKDGKDVADYVLEGIEAQWIEMRIPLRAFRGIEKVHKVTELVLVFDDETVTEPVGTLYLENVAFDVAP